MNRCSLALVLALAAAAAPGAAVAQPGAPAQTASGADAVKRAEAFYNQGVRLYSDKKWKEAEAAFRAAWALNPTFDVAYNLGSTLYQLGDHRGAAEYLALALRRWPLIGATSSMRQVAQKRFDEARGFVGALTVKVNVPHAEVLVDGKLIGRSPLEGEVFVEPGVHTLEARLEGYEGAKQTIEAAKGGTHAVELRLAPKAAAAAEPATGGDPVPAATQETSAAPVLDATNSRQTPAERPSPVVIGVGIGVGLAFVAAGVGAIVASSGEDSDRAKLREQVGSAWACAPGASPSAQCAELADASAAERTLRGVGIAGFVAGGAAWGATLAYALWPRGEGRREAIRFVPVQRAGGGGIEVVGTF